MSNRIRMAAVMAALAALAAVPAAAGAAVPMRGVVSGSPYGASNSQVAVPVLFSKETMRKARLRSPVGVIIVGAKQRVKLPGGAGFTTPGNLRIGDRFKGAGNVGPTQRRAFYPRVTFRNAAVSFRSKELSLAELSAAVDAIRRALIDLQNQLNALQGATFAGLQMLAAQIADLRKQLESLQGLTTQVTNITTQLTNLTNQLTSLLSQVTGLQNQVNTLVTQITTLTTRLGDACTGLKGATVLVGGLPVPVVFPPNTISTACP
jgi:hypothetical protein